jgi:hypothetical protein
MNAKVGEKEDQWYMVHRYILKKNFDKTVLVTLTRKFHYKCVLMVL